MTNNRKRIITGAAAAAGAVGAYFGARAVMRWMQGRQAQRQIAGQSYSRLGSGERTGARASSGRYQPLTQPDREPIPATGAPLVEAPFAPYLAGPETVTAGDLAGPLVHYLLAFHDMIHQLRLRRFENQPAGGAEAGRRSLTPDDRAIIQETLDRLEGQLPKLSDGDFAAGVPRDTSLPQRMVNLAVKVREAMQEPSYSDDDLFRINGEVRSEACQVLEEVLPAGPDVIEARRIYECS